MKRIPILLVASLTFAAQLAHADDKAKGTVDGAIKTGADAVIDSARTVGRSTHALFKGGAGAAKQTWKENARSTKENARANAVSTRQAARGQNDAKPPKK
jgi:hypothetical protein